MSVRKLFGRIPLPEFNFSDAYAGFKKICELLFASIMGGDYLSYEEIEVDDSDIVALTVPDGAVWAAIVCEADPDSDNPDRAIRFRQDGDGDNPPTADSGMPLGDNGNVDITGNDTLKSIRFIGIETGMTHNLRVEYYA